MRAWEILKPFWAWLMIAVGALLVALIALGYRDVVAHQRAQSEEHHTAQFPEGIRETDFGVPWSLRVFYVLTLGVSVWFVLWMWLSGHVF